MLERIDGPAVFDVLVAAPKEAGTWAERMCALHLSLHEVHLDGLPDLVDRLDGELAICGLEPSLVEELRGMLSSVDDGERVLCHWDFHPRNVLVGPDGPVVIDWLTVASGPAVADLARSLVLLQNFDRNGAWWRPFIDATRASSAAAARGASDEEVAAWVAHRRRRPPRRRFHRRDRRQPGGHRPRRRDLTRRHGVDAPALRRSCILARVSVQSSPPLRGRSARSPAATDEAGRGRAVRGGGRSGSRRRRAGRRCRR